MMTDKLQEWQAMALTSIDAVVGNATKGNVKVDGMPTSVVVFGEIMLAAAGFRLNGQLYCHVVNTTSRNIGELATALQEAKENKQPIVVGGNYDPRDNILEVKYVRAKEPNLELVF